MEERIGPLSNVVAYWDHNLGGYPTRVRLAMGDGTIQTFWFEPEQPKPQTEYIGKHAKKTGDAATSTGHKRN